MHPTPVPGLVSVVMLVRNRLEYTRRALASLARASGDFEVVVVDNGSRDGTAEHLAAVDLGHPLTVLRHEDDRGGSERRNTGAAAARGEYLFFLDNDVLVDDPRVVEVLAAELAADPGLGAVSPLLLYPGEVELVQCAGGGSTVDGRIGAVGRGRPPGPEHREHREQTWAPTAALMVRHSSFRRVGGFDEAFDPVSLCEDVDLCCRLRAGGERLRYVGSVAVRHFEGTTFNHVGHDKLPIWKRHTRVIRSRWAGLFARGPAHPPAALEWVPVRKDYSDLDRPRVAVLDDAAEAPADLSFFASDRVLATPEPADVRVLVVGTAAAVPDLGAVPGVRVVGVADSDLRSLLPTARAHGAPWALRDGARLVEEVPAEGVVVCGPDTAAVVTALRRGLHVLLAKQAVDDLASLVGAARAAPGRCSVDLPWAHHPELIAAGKAVTEGGAGVPRGFEVRLVRPEVPGADVVAELGPDALDAVERVLGVPVTGVRAVEATPDLVRAEAVAGEVTGTVEIGWGEPRFRIAVAGTGDDLVVDLVAPSVSGACADFVGALRGGPAPLTELTAVGGLLGVVSAWRSETGRARG
ncbi:glycosyltransferase [Saccharothrix syringae]|uniref:Glycosyltransferase n=1 Tax=Saccharothrix syringae TaxID=103733 RepID=A0A5Q0H6B6_SACSY|nr:glycosyltransferase [Saccharothrix syringae]QFZ21262.1 glycosyltransferase [Saccharothrix syringae]